MNKAVWDCSKKIYFIDNNAGVKIDTKGEIAVYRIDIDSLAMHPSFIKMDVEGNKLKALEGANNTIKENKPRLAICIYHKPEDFFEIGEYLLELVPEYNSITRHYASNMWGTVLYAYV